MFGTVEQRKDIFEIWDKYLQNTYPGLWVRIEQLVVFQDFFRDSFKNRK